MDKKQQKMYEALKELGTEEAVDVILDFLGIQILDDDFHQHLIDEGILEEEEDEEEE